MDGEKPVKPTQTQRDEEAETAGTDRERATGPRVVELEGTRGNTTSLILLQIRKLRQRKAFASQKGVQLECCIRSPGFWKV